MRPRSGATSRRRLAPRTGRRLPRSVGDLRSDLEVVDEPSQVTSDRRRVRAAEDGAHADVGPADRDEHLLVEAHARDVVTLALRYAGLDKVADRPDDRLELFRRERRGGVGGDHRNRLAGPVGQVNRPHLPILGRGAHMHAERQRKHRGHGGHEEKRDEVKHPSPVPSRMTPRGRGSIRFGQPDLSRPVGGLGKPQGSGWILGLMASRPILYSMDISHYCIAADRMLAFKGVEFETRPVPYHDKQELIKATGQDYVPTLIWDGKTVTWSEIPDFLEGVRPTPTFYPWGQKGLAIALEHWGHQVLEERVWRYVVTKVPPVLHDDQERWVFEEMQTRARGPWHVLEMRREEFRQDMNKHLGMVDAILDGRDWILGQPSLADFGIYGSISPLLTVGEMIPAEFPRLGRWASMIGKLGR